MEAAIAAALVLAHHAGRPEAHLGVAADCLAVGRRGVNGDPVMATLPLSAAISGSVPPASPDRWHSTPGNTTLSTGRNSPSCPSIDNQARIRAFSGASP
jgi:hypothetical protein